MSQKLYHKRWRPPKSVVINGAKWTVKTNPNRIGGYFDGETNIIEVGTKIGDKGKETFVHEVLEAILAMIGHRYTKKPYRDGSSENGDKIFVFTHDDFERFVPQIITALRLCDGA